MAHRHSNVDAWIAAHRSETSTTSQYGPRRSSDPSERQRYDGSSPSQAIMSSVYPPMMPQGVHRNAIHHASLNGGHEPMHVYPSHGPAPLRMATHDMYSGGAASYRGPHVNAKAQPPYGVSGYRHVAYPPYPTYPAPYPMEHPRAQLVQSSAPAQETVSDPVVPSYHGLIKTSTDAILLLAACDLPTDGNETAAQTSDTMMRPSPPPRRIHRRLLEHERPELIRPGSVFVWDEKDASMRRWTDGRCWSASRVSGCFLTYRELELRKRPASDGHGPRANQYKVEGLIKQSFSMTSGSGRKLHIVSYYTKRDLRHGTLRRVSEDPRFVGEAGGEWGLSVDENEFPDPVAATQDSANDFTASSPSQSHRAAQSTGETGNDNASVQDANGPDSSTVESEMSPRTSAAQRPPINGADSAYSPRVAAARSSMGVQPSSGLSIPLPPLALPSLASIQAGSSGPFRFDKRPELKRKRSSSAGEIGRQVRAPAMTKLSPRASGDMLTESNVRGAKLSSTPALPKFGNPDVLTPSAYTEQDSAAGALLSLRGSINGRGCGTNNTPLTTPEDSSRGPGTPLEAQALRKQSSGQGSSGESGTPAERPSGPDRLPSDRDALSKLSIRL